MSEIQERRKTVLFSAAIVFMGILLSFRVRYGVDLTDEAYYLAEAGRFFQGDRPFREEWFPAQLIGVLLLPAYTAYVSLRGNAEGIMLFMRLLYVLFDTALALLIFRTMVRKEGMDRLPAFFCSLFFLLYARANIQTLSYYNIGLGTFLVYLLWRHEEHPVFQVGSGISFAVSVLCMPYVTVYFAVLEALHAVQCIRKKRDWREETGFLAGIALSAAVFLSYCALSGNFGDILRNLPEVLQDPEHQSSIGESLFSFAVFMMRDFYRYLFWALALEFLGIAYYIWKGRSSRKIGMLLKGVAYALFFAQSAYVRTFFEGGIIIVLFLLAVQIAALEGEWETTLGKHYALPGLFYGLLWMCGSNVEQRAFNMGCIIACVWAVQVVWNEALRERFRWRRFLRAAPMALTAVVLTAVCFLDIYRDGSMETLTVKLEAGAAKGLYTTPARAAEYTAVLEDLEKYAGEGSVLAVGGTNPWLYLEAAAQCGTYAAWSVDFADERHETYYEWYPEKIPDVLFLLNPSYGTYEGWRYSSHGSNMNGAGTEILEGWLAELAEEESYCRLEEETGIFYVKE